MEKVIYYSLITFFIFWADLWTIVLVLWVLPFITIVPAILRLRSIVEHFGLEGSHELNMSRNLHPSWWECFLFVPHNCGYHLDHHLFPSVPFYNLKELHTLLKNIPEYSRSAHQTYGIFSSSESSLMTEITAAN
jgi:fatty acid desaturase